MKILLTRKASSMTELKTSPAKVLENACGEPVAIFNRNEPVAYLVPAEAVGSMQSVELNDLDERIERIKEKNKVALDNLKNR